MRLDDSGFGIAFTGPFVYNLKTFQERIWGLRPSMETEEVFDMDELYKKIYGCEAAAAIANSMGDITEGMTYQKIDEKYGLLAELLPQDKSGRIRKNEWGPDLSSKAHHRPAGMGEDGMERHRLLCTAIIDKGGRITVEDLARTWVRDIDPDKFGYLINSRNLMIYNALEAGLPPQEVGRYAALHGSIGKAKVMLPVGVVNACDPEQAAQDAISVGRMQDMQGVPGNYALEVAAAVAAGAACAFKPDATVDEVIQTALAQLSSKPRQEVQQGLTWADEHENWRDLRPLYQEKYAGRSGSDAVEVLSSALAVLRLSEGDPREAIIQSVNFGRDCDCRAYVAGGIAGVLRGIDAIPAEWVQTVEEALKIDQYTVSNRSLRESTDGLYQALINNLRKLKEQIEMVEAIGL